MTPPSWMHGPSLAVATVIGLAAPAHPTMPPTSPTLDPTTLGTVAIAPPTEALTFARVVVDGQPRVLAVTWYAGGHVSGVDVAQATGQPLTDPITALSALGYDRLAGLLAAPLAPASRTVAATDLIAPVDLTAHHVAAGTNYPEHAGEAEVEDGPFLFAKLVDATGPRAPVAVGDALLDYEVELAWVTLAPVAEGDRPAALGLMLCNDYTDRATLLRHVDPWNPTSGKGFTTGKSAPGYLPVGDLFVVPRDPRAFAAALQLRLWVNGRLRQRAQVAEQIWDLDAMLAQTWARRDVRWDHRGTAVALFPGDRLPARTLLMSGTPGGTVFAGIDVSTRVRGALSWLAGGLRQPVTQHVIETYIRRARAARTYLQPGDRVTIHVDRLGVIENPIVAGAAASAQEAP